MLELIVAFDEDRLIGRGKELPWHIPEDLKHFKEMTTGHRIIMGRVTFESIGKALPNRENIVLTRNDFEVSGVKTYKSVEELLKNLDDNKKNFVIGGNKLYEALLPYVDLLHISHVRGRHQGDVYFPEIDLSKWELINEVSYEKFNYRCYRRK